LAVLAVLDREQLQANAATMGGYLRRHLLDVTARRPCLGEVRGAGLLIGVEVVGRDIAAAKARTREIVNRLASHDRVLIGSEGPSGNILKLRPPMVFGSADADLVVRAIDEAAAAIDARDG
jgi:4-aminobutyrate aminotransferase-like enzyme